MSSSVIWRTRRDVRFAFLCSRDILYFLLWWAGTLGQSIFNRFLWSKACLQSTTLSLKGPNRLEVHVSMLWRYLESHAVSKPMKDCTNHPQTAHHNTEQGWPPTNNHNCPPVKIHEWWGAHPSMTTTHHDMKWVQLPTNTHSRPTNNMGCPPQWPTNHNHPPHKSGMTTHPQDKSLATHKHPHWGACSAPWWLSNPCKAAWQCQLTLALPLRGSLVNSGGITPHGCTFQSPPQFLQDSSGLRRIASQSFNIGSQYCQAWQDLSRVWQDLT